MRTHQQQAKGGCRWQAPAIERGTVSGAGHPHYTANTPSALTLAWPAWGKDWAG